jgi:hypothetical protein
VVHGTNGTTKNYEIKLIKIHKLHIEMQRYLWNKLSAVPKLLFSSLVSTAQCITIVKQAGKSLSGPQRLSVIFK